MLKTKSDVIQALEEKRFFKLVCGASLTDVKMVENLSFIFTLAGAHVIDLAPSADVVFAARKGIERAIKLEKGEGRREKRMSNSFFPSLFSQLSSPLIMASIQLDHDPHFRKVEVDYDLCDVCGACVKVCPTQAFVIARSTEGATKQSHKSDNACEIASPSARNDKLVYSIERCYGCNICPSCCHVDALKMIDTKPTPKETLKEMIDLGVTAIEFHFGKNYKKIEEIWNEIKDLVKNLELLSFSIGSDLLSFEEIKDAAKLCYKLAGSGIILQCDGTPMSGGMGEAGNNSDKSSLEVAKIIQEEKLPVYLQISGGTNINSYKNAISAGININGVAIGSYARKLLMPYLNDNNIDEALKIAKSLVNSVGANLCVCPKEIR